jgi:hypothetical protein
MQQVAKFQEKLLVLTHITGDPSMDRIHVGIVDINAMARWTDETLLPIIT